MNIKVAHMKWFRFLGFMVLFKIPWLYLLSVMILIVGYRCPNLKSVWIKNCVSFLWKIYDNSASDAEVITVFNIED